MTNNTWVEQFQLPTELAFDEKHFHTLWGMRPNAPHQVKVFGKIHNTPRLQQAYGKDYMFSGTVSKALPIPNEFKPILEFVSKRYDVQYNGLLINWYRDGNDYIGYHSDDEKSICQNTPIITISLGVERDFLLKNKSTNEVTKYTLKNNSVFVMGGACQQTHKHSIPKRKKITEPRISITMRVFNSPVQ